MMNANASTPNAVRRPRKKETLSFRRLLLFLLFFPASIFFMELVLRLRTFGDLHFGQFLLILFFSVSSGALIGTILTVIKNHRAVRIVARVLTILLYLLYGSQIVYYFIFKSYYSLESVGMAGTAIHDFFGQVVESIWMNLFFLILLAAPIVVICVFGRYLTEYGAPSVPPIMTGLLAALTALTFTVGALAVAADRSDYGYLYYYNHPTDKETAMDFGLLTATRLNLGRILFGGRNEEVGPIIHMETQDVIFRPTETTSPAQTDPGVVDPPESGDAPGTDVPPETAPETDPPRPIPQGDNVLDIDFASLIANAPNKTIKKMHTYFSSLTPTPKNEYTGYFEGKNLIFMTLEGFSHKAIREDLTPTLYKMANEGFVFTNFYNSLWGGSTATGEYANMTGNFYNKASCLKMSGSTYQPFAYGNLFRAAGYTTVAYHAHTYTYYSRNLSHPNFGYDFLAIGNGLENLKDPVSGKTISGGWPRSDYESARITFSEYIDKQPFHAYYMTISGHANYNFGGNNMSRKHRPEVKDLPYSDEVQAYLACQIEVELMVKELIAQLDAAGILENTVFVMQADHYPYALSDAAKAELYGLPQENIYNNFELYKNALIIWSASMKHPVVVDTPCSAIDIMPTVANLFGLPYDSRLIAGTDVLSGVDPLVILNCDGNGTSWNWITKYGVCISSNANKFTLNPNYTVDKDALKSYVNNMIALLKAKRTYSYLVLENDYYAYVFGKK